MRTSSRWLIKKIKRLRYSNTVTTAVVLDFTDSMNAVGAMVGGGMLYLLRFLSTKYSVGGERSENSLCLHVRVTLA